MTNIAFIGLGVMGSPMASNLVKAGYEVIGWNRTPNRPLVQQAAQAGVKLVSTIAEALKETQIILTCVSDVGDINSLLFDEGGIVDHAPNNALIIDFSTIGAIAAREIATNLQDKGFRFLDAPISGGDIGAQQGTLTIMVGGEEEDFRESLPLLEVMGQKIVYCGESGKGQAVKLCNQVLCSLHMVALCEAMELAQQLNLDPNLMIDVCSSGAAGSWALSHLGHKIAEADFAPGFMIKHIVKDLRLVQESAKDLELPGLTLADTLFKAVYAKEGEEQGTQAMIRAYREKNKN
ncbi:MAG: NAD(P)-dependent oxidoreductase [Microcystaceae cyanobacterium]